MVYKLASSFISNWRSRLRSIFRKSWPISKDACSTTATDPVSSSLPTPTMIDSPSATAAVQPGIVIPDPERDTSRDRWDRPRLGQDVVPVLTVVGPILEAIPIAGPALKATVGAVLEILKTINQINQNKGDFEKLEEKLRCLEDHISSVPVPPQGISKARDDLTRQLQATLIKLRSIQGERRIRYSIVAQTISECSLDIDHYIQRYTALEVMDMRGKMDMYISSTSPMRSKITGVVFIDATGRKYEVSMDSSRSYEMFKKTMALFFDGDRMEARIQRRYMEEGRYDLCIERGNRIIPIAGEEDWTAIEPGMQLTMRAIIAKYWYDTQRHECPRCKTWNFSRGGASVFVECQGCDCRFQISVSRYCGLGDVRPCEEDRQSGMEMGVLINLHLKEYTPTASRSQMPVLAAWKCLVLRPVCQSFTDKSMFSFVSQQAQIPDFLPLRPFKFDWLPRASQPDGSS